MANTPQERLNKLIAEGGSPVAIRNLQKQLGISGGDTTVQNASPASTVTNVPDTSLTNNQSQFEQGWQAYIDASKSAYDIDTNRTLESYDLQQQQYDLQQARNREDYAKYTSDAQTQMNRQLASPSKEFARKLASASTAYGQRGILRSGIAKQQTGDATSGFVDEQTYFKTASQRALEAGQQSYDRNYADITTAENNLNTKKDQYGVDRTAGKAILENTLQNEGDTQYNTQQTQQWATEQERLRQDAKNKVAGVTSSPSLRTWRRGGVYTPS